jgi:hypothetical protein
MGSGLPTSAQVTRYNGFSGGQRNRVRFDQQNFCRSNTDQQLNSAPILRMCVKCRGARSGAFPGINHAVRYLRSFHREPAGGRNDGKEVTWAFKPRDQCCDLVGDQVHFVSEAHGKSDPHLLSARNPHQAKFNILSHERNRR